MGSFSKPSVQNHMEMTAQIKKTIITTICNLLAEKKSVTALMVCVLV